MNELDTFGDLIRRSHTLVENLSRIPGVKAKVGGISLSFQVDDQPVIEHYLPPVEIDNPPDKLCHKCGEYWPETTEFFQTDKFGKFFSPCKACSAERRAIHNGETSCCISWCNEPRRNAGSSRCEVHQRQYSKAYHALKKRRRQLESEE